MEDVVKVSVGKPNAPNPVFQQKPKIEIKMGQGKDKDAVSLELTFYCEEGTDINKALELAVWAHHNALKHLEREGYKVIPYKQEGNMNE